MLVYFSMPTRLVLLLFPKQGNEGVGIEGGLDFGATASAKISHLPISHVPAIALITNKVFGDEGEDPSQDSTFRFSSYIARL